MSFHKLLSWLKPKQKQVEYDKKNITIFFSLLLL